jgi:hypothetical protein
MAAQTEFRIDMKRDRFEAPMFNSKVWQIGPDGVSQVPDVKSPFPYAAHAYLRPGQRAASSPRSASTFICKFSVYKLSKMRCTPRAAAGPYTAASEF